MNAPFPAPDANLPPTDAASGVGAGLQHGAFYKFTSLANPGAAAQQLRALTQDVLGTIWVAPEGINGAVAGSPAALDALEHALLAQFGGALAGMAFKRSACRTAPFKRMRVLQKPELVPLGLPSTALASPSPHAPGATGAAHAAHQPPGLQTPHPQQATPSAAKPPQTLSPQAWRELIAQGDVLVLDNRNSFEYRLGHFKGAQDPQVAHFRDFARYVAEHAPQWQRQGQRVAMYCTGGIRCEKTAPWMASLGLDVYQLDGGILNYFAQMPGAAQAWQGECFVFDNRIALDTQLEQTHTTLEQVYQGEADGAWRLARARRLLHDD